MTLELAEPGRLVGWGSDLIVAAQIAERVAGTEFVPAAMRGKPDVVVAAILYGAEIGIDPMQALNSIHVVEGRPQPSAELVRALILRAGHVFQVHELSGTRVRVSGVRAGRPETERVYVEWTLDQARAAGLLGRKNWQTHPRAMLMARATGDLGRWLFPDVIKGLSFVAELADDRDEQPMPELDASEPEPKPRKAIQRMRKPPPARKPAPVAEEALGGSPEPVEPEEAELVAPRRIGGRVPVPDPPPERHTYAQVDEPAPELDPEAGPPEPPPEPGELPEKLAIGPGLLKALHAALTRELGTVATRPEKLAMLTAILGREITSSKVLTPSDGHRALDFLGRVASGQATWEFDILNGTAEKPLIKVMILGPEP